MVRFRTTTVRVPSHVYRLEVTVCPAGREREREREVRGEQAGNISLCLETPPACPFPSKTQHVPSTNSSLWTNDMNIVCIFIYSTNTTLPLTQT